MDFQTFHKYNRLVRRGMASPITCTCGSELVVGMDKDEEPMLKCYQCGSRITPGLRLYESLAKHVKSFEG